LAGASRFDRHNPIIRDRKLADVMQDFLDDRRSPRGEPLIRNRERSVANQTQ
jgi:hypothetical protein